MPLDLLRKIPLFSELSDDQLETLLAEFVERTESGPHSPDDTIGAIQEELEEIATCFIHSTGRYVSTGKTRLVFLLLVGTLALIAVIRVKRRRS